MKYLITIALFGGFLLTSALFAEINLVPGNFSVKTSMEIQGMTMPAASHNQCITKNENVPNHDDKCKITKQSIKGSVVTWTMQCDRGGVLNGRIKYAGKSFAGTMKMSAKGKEINYKISGTRTGSCK